jgi:hypothetical protein
MAVLLSWLCPWHISGGIAFVQKSKLGQSYFFHSADKGTIVIMQSKDFFHEIVDFHVPQCQCHLKFP